MALDGIVISSLVNELDTNITGGRITKIAQPEKDELLLTIKQSKTDENGKTARSTKRAWHTVNVPLAAHRLELHTRDAVNVRKTMS